MNADIRILTALVFLTCQAVAQQSLDSAYRTTGPEVVAAFDSQRAVLQTSSAVIQQGRRQLAYGVVVSADGAILTKASELEGAEGISVLIDRRTFRDVEIVATDPVWDVALLRVDADDLTPVEFLETDAGDLPHGTWVVANGATSRFARRAMAGVISAKPRTIPAAGGAVLGVVLKVTDDGLRVESVVEASGAERAGLKEGDILKAVDGTDVEIAENIVEAIGERTAGEIIEVRYLRDGEETTVDVPLIAREELFAEQMMNRNDMMSGDFSKRRSGFPRVIQHDILGNSSSVGGPLLDLDGRCVGMNIARANRAESFAIPAGEVREIAARLMSRKP
ncbi:MAG: S1C family serine protease [Luteolibacter sp.]